MQRDLVGGGLIDELEVKCLSKECPYRGKFNDYKMNHHKVCKMGGEGLEAWMHSMKDSLNGHVVKRRYSSGGE